MAGVLPHSLLALLFGTNTGLGTAGAAEFTMLYADFRHKVEYILWYRYIGRYY